MTTRQFKHIHLSLLTIVSKLGSFGIIVALTACAADHSGYIKNVEKLNASEYSKVQTGNIQNFTIIKIRMFDRKQQHEVSNKDDPGDQRQILNLGNDVYVSSITPKITTKFVQSSISMAPSWDKFYLVDWKESPDLTNFLAGLSKVDASEVKNYVALGKTTKKDGVTSIDDMDYAATIRDQGDTIYYSDAAVKLKFLKQPMPKVEVHPDWDGYYRSDNNKMDILKSSKKGLYRLGFIADGVTNTFEFLPLFGLYQSTKIGLYRAVAYNDKARKWVAVDAIPTKTLICLDLARAYDKATNYRNQAVTQAALNGILLALGGVSTTTFSGTVQSKYDGYYAGYNLSVTGTDKYTGYAKTYDYSYLALGAVGLLDTVFKENATVDQITIAIQQQQCGFDL
jgi:hypothetical protein